LKKWRWSGGGLADGDFTVLIAMAGLPASGKSTLAACLAQELRAVVLDKDLVRAALFPAPVLDYSAVQDDIAMAAIYQAAAEILRAEPQRVVILDGRTFVLPNQLQPVLELCSSVGEQEARIIECVCDDAIARQRLEKDLAERKHPARNRTYGLYHSMKAKAVPLTVPHLVVDTGRLLLVECVQQCMKSLFSQRGPAP
jgi:predicted kinase